MEVKFELLLHDSQCNTLGMFILPSLGETACSHLLGRETRTGEKRLPLSQHRVSELGRIPATDAGMEESLYYERDIVNCPT